MTYSPIRPYWTRLLLFAVALGLTACTGAQEDHSQDFRTRRARMSLAGRGDPWSHLTSESKYLFLALHERLPPTEVEGILGLTREELLTEIERLQEVGLLKAHDGWYVPDFFVANREDTETVYAHARETGRFLARELLDRWEEVEEGFADLSLSRTHSLEEMGFLLLGGRILDMGMLAALVDDGALLGGAPLRPSPGRPDARYYFWAVEGDPEHLGRYGENSLELPSTNWRFITFGMNYVNGESNAARNALHDRFEELMEAHPEGTPALFAQELSVPLLTLEDSELWASFSAGVSRDLVERLMESGPDIPGFFRTLPSGQYAQDRLAEFVVWYYHLAFAWAIDHLEEDGAIVIPSSGFSSLISYAEDGGGLLKGF